MNWRIRLNAALIMVLSATGMTVAQQPQLMPDAPVGWSVSGEAVVEPATRIGAEALPLVPPEPAAGERVPGASLAPVLRAELSAADPVLAPVVPAGTTSVLSQTPPVALEPWSTWTSPTGEDPFAGPAVPMAPLLARARSSGSLEPESLPAISLPESADAAPIAAAPVVPSPMTTPVSTSASPWVEPNSSIGAATRIDPTIPLLLQHQPQLTERLYEQVLELEPNRDNRRTIERVRKVVQETQVGINETDENWSAPGDGLQVVGRFHLDWVNWANDADYRGGPGDEFDGMPNYVEFRRLRLGVAGEGYGVLFYQLEFEFSPEIDLRGTVDSNDVVDLGEFGIEVKDAYLGMRDVPWLGTVLLGHFFTPMGLELQTSSNFITFLERGLPRVFLPGRELGVAAYNSLPNQRMNWAYGIFFDEMNEAAHSIVDDNQGTRLVGRVTGTPFYDELSDGRYLMHLGLGYAYTVPRRRDSPTDENGAILIEEYRPVDIGARPEIHRGPSLVSTDKINTKQYHILNGEFAWVHGPLSIQSELVWESLDELDGGVSDFYGSYFFASYFLTGEHRRYDRRVGDFKRMSPYENFWLVRTPRGTSSGWGAWEMAARWSYLDLTDVQGQQLNDLTLGVNWYWNPYTRMMFNWIHPFTHNSPLSELPDAGGDILAMRMQVDF